MRKKKKIRIQESKRCYVCGDTNVELHHMMEQKKLAEEDGLVIWLCPMHHRISNNSAHMNKEFREELHRMAQRQYLKHHQVSEWMARYGQNYI